jgi:hypothetical protein
VQELEDRLGAFHPPQGYVRLAASPDLLRVCQDMAAQAPLREMIVPSLWQEPR